MTGPRGQTRQTRKPHEAPSDGGAPAAQRELRTPVTEARPTIPGQAQATHTLATTRYGGA